MFNLSNEHVARLIEIARAYYVDNATQAEIARMLGLSRSMVSRDLALAREIGVVEININDPRERVSVYLQQLTDLFPQLEHIIVTPTFSDDPEALRATIGRFAANYLSHVLQPDQNLVLGCGRTLRSTIDSLPRQPIPDIKIIQAMGNIGHEAHGIDYNEIARHAADSLGGRIYYVSAPAILGNRAGNAQEFTESNPTIGQALARARQADVVVVGLGSLESDQLYVQAGLIEASDLDAIRDRAVGDICGRFFDIEGNEVLPPFAPRLVGITLDVLKQARITIGIAGGADKIEPLIGALNGQYINVLVSDEQTVKHVIQRVQKHREESV